MTLQQIRKRVGVSQKELADQLGVFQSAVSQWETGKAIPRGATLLRLAEILGCTVDELLKGEGKEHDGNRDEA